MLAVRFDSLKLLPAVLLCAVVQISSAEPPRLSSDAYHLEMVASDPDIATPIGMAFDHKGRLLVIESHTHQRPKDYAGPAGDRIRMFADSDHDGKLDKWTTFSEGFLNAMNLLVRDDGAVYVVTRQDLQLLRDTDGDGKVDESKTLMKLETTDTYPHNGLEGIALMPDGKLLIAMGENHGLDFHLIGSDGSSLTGQGEGGSIFRCTQDGGALERWAVGFWNPFSLCTTPAGRIFVADNDPDASPPCRLVEGAPGGDYGFRFRYGRAGLHPLQAWNGELPGTLPMVCGIGEAPTAIILHRGRLWVTSWGDHRVEAYTLAPRGASYTATREVVVQGDTDFRPTGMAVAPDGSIYFGDWIRREYPVHGHGRVWHLTFAGNEQKDQPSARATFENTPPVVVARADVEVALASDDPFLRAAAVWTRSHMSDLEPRLTKGNANPKVRLGLLEALRLKGSASTETVLSNALKDSSPEVRLFAIRWIADDRIVSLRPQVAKLLDSAQPDTRYSMAVLAAVDWLGGDGQQINRALSSEVLTRELEKPPRSTAAQVLILSLLPPDDKFLTLDRLQTYLSSDDAQLRLEAVRILAQQADSDRYPLLAKIAQDKQQMDAVRAEAIAGLAGAAEQYRELLGQFAADNRNSSLRREAQRVLRLTRLAPSVNEQKPAADDLAAWTKLLSAPGDAEAGRRLFFSSVGARCGVCHQYSGRGGRIGPDLTRIGQGTPREKIIASILQPSREVAPDFQAWTLVTQDGRSFVGLRLAKSGDDGQELYADPAGQKFTLRGEEIEFRSASPKSIMPDGLEKLISVDDLRDLLAFLTSAPDQKP